MLTAGQKCFLAKIPQDKVVRVKPFNPLSKKIASEIIREIKKKMPNTKVRFIGSAALSIAGQDDIDLSIVSNGNFDEDRKNLLKLFGKPVSDHRMYVQWEFERKNFSVELSLNREMSPQIREQIDVFELLSSNSDLKDQFEKTKLEMNGRAYGEYQAAKYKFFNRILGFG